MPFSDPCADGNIIEKANHKALKNGFELEHTIHISQQIAKQIDTLWMGYSNIFFDFGFCNVIQKIKDLRLKGLIVPDIPYEHRDIVTDENFLIPFVSPITSRERIKKILDKKDFFFIYLLSYMGITGNNQNKDLSFVIENIRKVNSSPIYIGFGVDDKNAKAKAKGADGVIVGSLFVKILLDESLNNAQKINKIVSLSRNIKESINS